MCVCVCACTHADEVIEKSLVKKHEQLGRRVSFKDEMTKAEAKLEPLVGTGSDRTEGAGQGEGPKDQDNSPKGKTF